MTQEMEENISSEYNSQVFLMKHTTVFLLIIVNINYLYY